MKILRLAPLLLASSLSLAQTERTTLPAATVERLDAVVESAMTDGNLPGVVVGVWIPGEGEYVRAFGAADLATGRAREPDDPFRIASITKTFTATAVLQLVDEGALATSDPISRWFPDFPNADEITVRDLLAMRSGIADYADAALLADYYRDPAGAFDAQDAIDLSAAKADAFTAPDETTVYTNTNYILLEQIVERESGEDFDTFLAERVLLPLGMADTFYATGLYLPGDLRGYSLDADTGAFRDTTVLNPALPGGAGAVVSTLGDLHAYVRALCTGALLEPATQAERLAGEAMAGEPDFVRYGEGVLLLGPFCGHNGTIFGFSSEAFYLPARDAVIVINVNRLDLDDHSWSTELFLRLTQALFPDEVPW